MKLGLLFLIILFCSCSSQKALKPEKESSSENDSFDNKDEISKTLFSDSMVGFVKNFKEKTEGKTKVIIIANGKYSPYFSSFKRTKGPISDAKK